MKHTGKLSVSESNNLVILNDKHQMIAGADTRQRNCHEIAAEIVRRWNAHEGLRNALQNIMDDLPSKRDWLDPDVEKLAREALAEAKKP